MQWGEHPMHYGIDVVVPDQMLAAIFPDGIFIIPTRKTAFPIRIALILIRNAAIPTRIGPILIRNVAIPTRIAFFLIRKAAFLTRKRIFLRACLKKKTGVFLEKPGCKKNAQIP
jgi:hypothetical protein